jgi:glucose/arabinose dehydrogenase
MKSALFVFLGLIGFTASAQTFPTGFERVPVAIGISSPTVMAFAPDGRIFVAQQNGALRVVKDGTLLDHSLHYIIFCKFFG